VAVLTTIVPGKEPVDLVMNTLRAMKRIRHDGPMDVWLLDEGDDPDVRRRCEEIGVRHFSRKGHTEWNQPSGPFRAKTKHGNHNAWRQAHELDYDVVAQMDPDHVPFENFLERTLGYFADPDTRIRRRSAGVRQHDAGFRRARRG
jgi:cellulose synthase (UDP-forming)